MPDTDGYPTETELETLAKYDLLAQPIDGLLVLIQQLWRYPDYGYKLTGKRV